LRTENEYEVKGLVFLDNDRHDVLVMRIQELFEKKRGTFGTQMNVECLLKNTPIKHN